MHLTWHELLFLVLLIICKIIFTRSTICFSSFSSELWTRSHSFHYYCHPRFNKKLKQQTFTFNLDFPSNSFLLLLKAWLNKRINKNISCKNQHQTFHHLPFFKHYVLLKRPMLIYTQSSWVHQQQRKGRTSPHIKPLFVPIIKYTETVKHSIA